jgi:ribosomal protein L7/L12
MDYKIEQVDNGFIIRQRGQTTVCQSLSAACLLVGEQPPYLTYTTYADKAQRLDYARVREMLRERHKIDAIKHVRDVFHPRLGLREAKDLVEALE